MPDSKPAPRRRRPAKPQPAPALADCPACKGLGETTETVRVGSRKQRETGDRQAALCLTCFGTGHGTD